MLHSTLRYSLLAGLFALTACGGGGDDDSGSNAGTGGTAPAAGMGGSGGSTSGAGGSGGTSGTAGGGTSGSAGMPAAGTSGMCETAIVTTPEKNYEFSSKLTIDFTTVKPLSDLTFDWSGVTTDFLKRPVDLNEIDMVEITLWEKTVEEFQTQLNNDTLGMPIVIAHIPNDKTHATTGKLFDLNAPAGPLNMETILSYVDPMNYAPESNIYAVMLASGDEYGKGTHMLAGFKLDAASTNTDVKITSASTKVDFKATLASRPPTYVPAGSGAVTIDWTKMKVTASGDEFIPSYITRFRIGHYTQTPAELEGDSFLQLDEIAQEMYEAPVDVGTKISFDKAMTKDGKAFAGIDSTGTWIVALNCGTCQNPAPWYLSVLKPCP